MDAKNQGHQFQESPIGQRFTNRVRFLIRDAFQNDAETREQLIARLNIAAGLSHLYLNPDEVSRQADAYIAILLKQFKNARDSQETLGRSDLRACVLQFVRAYCWELEGVW